MKKKHWSLSLLFALLLVLAPVNVGHTASTVLRLAIFAGPVGTVDGFLRRAISEVEQRTEGRIKIETYYSETLVKSKEMLRAVEKGIANMAQVATGYFPSELPLNNVQTIILYTPKGNDAAWVGRKGWEVTEKTTEMYEEFKKFGQVPWFIQPYDGYHLYTNKAVQNLSDMKGMRIRVSSDGEAKFLMAIGAVPMHLPAADTYVGLQKGTIDGCFASMEYGKRYGYHEVAKNVVLTGTTVHFLFITVATKDLNKMSEKDRTVFMEIGKRISLEYGDALAKQWSVDKEAMEKAGVKMVPFPQEEIVKWSNTPEVRNIFDDWVAKQKAAGRPGDKVLESFLRVFEIQR